MLDKFADSLRSPPGQPDPDIACGDAGRWMRPTGPGETAVPVQGAIKRVYDRFSGSFHWICEDQTTRAHRGSGDLLQDMRRQRSQREGGGLVSSARTARTVFGVCCPTNLAAGLPLCAT